MFCFTVTQARAATLNVPGDYATIQACIDAAVSGVDECVVAPGTYVEAINFNGKAITLRSSGGAAVTTINGNGAFHVVQCISGEGPDTVLDGFTITGGDATGTVFPDNAGGGMFNTGSSPTVTNCTFSENSAIGGGAMANLQGGPTVDNCVFDDNSADQGGAMASYGSAATVSNCSFERNTASSGGGGMYSWGGNMTIRGSAFTKNTASDTESFSGAGGAMVNVGNVAPFTSAFPCGDGVLDIGEECDGSQDAACPGLCGPDCHCFRPVISTVTDCTFSNNSASGGGAIVNLIGVATEVRVSRCEFHGNTAALGGGMANVAPIGPTPPSPILGAGRSFRGVEWMPTLRNVVSTDASVVPGGSIAGTSQKESVRDGTVDLGIVMAVTDCTFTGNTAAATTDLTSGGGALFSQTPQATVTRCTFTGNAAFGTPTFVGVGGAVLNATDLTATNCMFDGNTAGTGGAVASGDALARDPSVNLMSINCKFSGNSALTGVGMDVQSGTATVTNCTFIANNATAIDVFPPIVGCAILIDASANAIVNNSLMWSDMPDELSTPFAGTVNFSDVQGGLPPGAIDGGGNIDADPLFVRNPNPGPDGLWDGVNDDFGDLRLQNTSPSIDTGDAALLPADGADVDADGNMTEPLPIDLDAHPRVLCGQVDMGAYEFGIGDVDCNGVVNLSDFASWATCVTGPDGGPFSAGCEALDFDADDVITLRDFGGFQSAIGGG